MPMSMKSIQLYNKDVLPDLQWPQTPDAEYARSYLTPMIQDGVSPYIVNCDTEMMVLAVDDLVLPVTINHAEYENSYVCSPYTHYIRYAAEELRNLENPIMRHNLYATLAGMGAVMRAGRLNKVVHVNNWLLSTNLYPPMTLEQIQTITHFLCERFPDHAIVFRSINSHVSHNHVPHFENTGYRMIASRQVYVLDTTDPAKFQSRQFRQDYKLWKKSDYKVVDGDQLSESDAKRIVELYTLLYLDKYSMLNPQFTSKFIVLAMKNKLLNIKVLVNTAGRIDAVLGTFIRNGVMTTPLYGYDTRLPVKLGLYRMLSTILTTEARSRQVLLNRSSGAAQFKRLRSADPAIEYSAVFDEHLPRLRRIPWIGLEQLINRVGKTLLEKYEL